MATLRALSKIGVPIMGGEFRASSAQNMATGANKLNFGTTIQAARNITWNGTQFTTLEDGFFWAFASIKVSFVSGNSWGVSIGNNAYAANGQYFPEDFSYNTTDAANSGGIWLPSGSVIAAYAYNNGGAVDLNFAARPAIFRVWGIPTTQ